MVRKPCEKESTMVARTQPEVVTPVTKTVSIAFVVKILLMSVPKNAEGKRFKM